MLKKILFLVCILFISWCQQENVRFLYTVSEFEDKEWSLETDSIINKKQSKWSNVYEVHFESRTNYSKKNIMASEKKIVYHDFCSVDETIYAVGWEFGEGYSTARLVQIYPNVENPILYNNSEIRLRDCTYIEQDNKKYLSMVSHWKWKVYLYDVINKSIITEEDAHYIWEIDWKNYEWITMIHEVISADLNNDWKQEIYYTPSSKNTTTYSEQKWKILSAEVNNWNIVQSEFFDFKNLHAKEIHNVVLKNWKEILIASVQWKTQINEKKNREAQKVSSLTFKDWTKRVIKDTEEITDIIRWVELKSFYQDWDIIKSKELLKIGNTVQCRIIEYGDLYWIDQEINLIVWCNDWNIFIYSLNNNIEITLKEALQIPWKKIRSLHIADTDNDWLDEVFIWVDFDWIYHLNIKLKQEDKLFKMFDYTWTESWFWSMESI